MLRSKSQFSEETKQKKRVIHGLAKFAGLLLLASPLCLGQSGTAAVPPLDTTASNAAAIKGAFPTSLAKSLDSKKLKDGDTVVCTTVSALHSGSGMMIPSGSKVIGHITQAEARSKGDSQSSLAMVFDKIQMPNGTAIPMKGTLQAIGPSLGDSGPNTGVAEGGTMPGRPGSGDAATTPPPSSGSLTGVNAGIHPLEGTRSRPLLTAQSVGVLGIKNLRMGKDAVITTPGKEVKLDNGTQMLIRAEIEVPVQ